MADKGDNSPLVSKPADDTAHLARPESGSLSGGGAPEDKHGHNHVPEDEHNDQHNDEHKEGQGAKPNEISIVSASRWLASTWVNGLGSTKAIVQLAEYMKPKLSEQLIPVLTDGLQLVGGPGVAPIAKKSYDISLRPEEQAERKFPWQSPPRKIMIGGNRDLYSRMRNAQLEHVSVGERLTRPERARLAAWTAFPENDAECEEGRKVTEKYIAKVLSRTPGAALTAAERAEDNHELAKIYSLQINDHDYTHNEDENPETRPQSVHHLPKTFMGWGKDKDGNPAPQEFKLQELAEKHMFKVLQGTYKTPLTPEERANLAFYSQVMRRVLPENLLDVAHTAQREQLLKEYVDSYSKREHDLKTAGKIVEQNGRTVWQNGQSLAKAEFKSVAEKQDLKIRPVLSDADQLYEHLTLSELRQLRLEAYEMAHLPRTDISKGYELAAPDQERLHEFSTNQFNKVTIATREYDEGHRLAGRKFIRTVDGTSAKQYIPTTPRENTLFAAWQGTPDRWPLVYLSASPESNFKTVQTEAWDRWPAAQVCEWSRLGADYFTQYQDPNYLENYKNNQAGRATLEKTLVWLAGSLSALNSNEQCAHSKIPRRIDRNIR